MSTVNESDRNAYCKILTLLRLLSQQTFTSSKSTAETLEKDFTLFSSVFLLFIVDFEQVNVSCVLSYLKQVELAF